VTKTSDPKHGVYCKVSRVLHLYFHLVFLQLVGETINGRHLSVPEHQDRASGRKVSWVHFCCNKNTNAEQIKQIK
jgi:hypothetical protein